MLRFQERNKIQAILGLLYKGFPGALHRTRVRLGRLHHCYLLSSVPSAWQPKGAASAGMGGCHGNLNRQSRNEFPHQRSASKLNSTSLMEKRSDGKCPTLCRAPRSCPCPQGRSAASSPTMLNGGTANFWCQPQQSLGWESGQRDAQATSVPAALTLPRHSISPKQGEKYWPYLQKSPRNYQARSLQVKFTITLFTWRQQYWLIQRWWPKAPDLFPDHSSL